MAKKSGLYKGQPANPDSVKFKTDFQGMPIHIDRPKGFVMMGTDENGKPWSRRYKYDYGFIPKTKGGDGDGLDVFIGPDKKATETYWAVQSKPDGSFDEYKCLLGFANKAAAREAYEAHIPANRLKRIVPMSIDMMRALVGVEPMGITKAAAFMDELAKIEGLCAH